jgi:hypothetical protein
VKKHLFHKVSQDPSNTVNTYCLIGKMNKNTPMLLLVIIIAVSLVLGNVSADTTVKLSQSVVQPGDLLIIDGIAEENSIVLVRISNTRNFFDSFNITATGSGRYRLTYEVDPNSPTDIYTVRVNVNEEYSELSFIVSRMNSEQLATTLRSLVMKTKRQAETVLIEARKQGKIVPEVLREKYLEGLSELENAANAIRSQKYLEAYEALQNSLNRFKEVVAYTYSEEINPPVDPNQKQIMIQEKIDELKRQHSELISIVYRLKNIGLNMDVLEGELDMTQQKISEVQNLLNEGNMGEAERSILQLQNLIHQRLSELRQKQANTTKRLAERYEESLENRVDTYIDTFQRLQTLKPIKSMIALEELTLIKQNLKESQELLEEDKVINALIELRDSEIRLKKLSDIVNGPIVKSLLNRLDSLTANLYKLSEDEAGNIQKEIEEIKNSLQERLVEQETSSNTSTQIP